MSVRADYKCRSLQIQVNKDMEQIKLWLHNVAFDRRCPEIVKLIESFFYGRNPLELAGFSFPREAFPFEATSDACKYFSGLDMTGIRKQTVELFKASFLEGYTEDRIESLSSLVLIQRPSNQIEYPVPPKLLHDLYSRSKKRHLGPLDKAFFILEELLKDESLSETVSDIGRLPLLKTHRFPKVRDLPIFILQNTKRCIGDLRRFSRRLEVEYGYEGEIKAFYNYMNMMLHNFAVESSMRPTETKKRGYFVCSAIHPVYDDYIDSGTFDATFPDRMCAYLNGAGFVPENVYERSIFALLNELRTLFPYKRHERLWHILSELHDAQVKSHSQSVETLGIDQILEISFEKGGMAFAFYGYVACGGLTEHEFAHFYAMGAIFQLMDDLHDVEDDLSEGVQTVFTKDVQENGLIRKSLLGLVAMQVAFERETGLVKGFRNSQLIRLIEMIGVRYDTTRFTALSAQVMDSSVMKFFRERYHSGNLSVEEIFQNTREHEDLDNYLLIIDRLMQIGGMRARDK